MSDAVVAGVRAAKCMVAWSWNRTDATSIRMEVLVEVGGAA